MPLPLIIGAAVAAAAAAAAAIKAVSDDDSSSNSSSSGAEKRQQEREAERQLERNSLQKKLKNLKRNQLESAHGLLLRSAEALGKQMRVTVQSGKTYKPGISKEVADEHSGTVIKLTSSKLKTALTSGKMATSEYAQALSSVFKIGGALQSDFSSEDLKDFLINLQVLESLASSDHDGSSASQSKSQKQDVGMLGTSVGSIVGMPSNLQGLFGTSIGSIVGMPSNLQGQEQAKADLKKEPAPTSTKSTPAISLIDTEYEDFEKIRVVSTRLERLQELKSQIEQLR